MLFVWEEVLGQGGGWGAITVFTMACVPTNFLHHTHVEFWNCT